MGKLKAVIILLACALLISTLGGQGDIQAQSDDADRAFDRALELHKSGDVLGAIREYQAILAQHPGRVDVRSNLGAAYAQLGRFQEAIAEYQRALAVDNNNSTIRFNLALAFYKAADFAEASGQLSQIIAAQPQNTTAVLLLADCQLRLGEYKKVIELLTPLEANLGNDRVFVYILGTALLNDKQTERGQALIDRILREGDSAEARAMIGTAYMMTGDYQSALKEFEQALKMNRRAPTVNSLHGRALLATGDIEQAAQAFQRELEINPNDFESNLYLGILLKKEGKTDEALGYFQRAAQVRPNDLNARYHIGGLYILTGKIAEAQQILEAVVKQAPDFVEARVLLAKAYYRLKRKADGDREQAIIQKLNAERQARQSSGQQGTGNSYGGGRLPELQDATKKP